MEFGLAMVFGVLVFTAGFFVGAVCYAAGNRIKERK